MTLAGMNLEERVIVLRPGERLVIMASPAALALEIYGEDGRRYHALKIAALMNCSLTELADILRRSPSSLKRRPEGNAELQRRLGLLARVATLVIHSTNLSYFQEWLQAPVPTFLNQRPIDVLKTEGGTEELINTIHGVLSGSFS